MAEAWIQTHSAHFATGVSVLLAMTFKETLELIDCMSIEGISKRHQKGELAYWVAVPYWNKGYGSEAARVFHDLEVYGLLKSEFKG